MPRNPKFPLTPAQQRLAENVRPIALDMVADESLVKVAFVKRDGTDRILTGTAVSVEGEGCSEILTVMTDEGIRSANLWRIHKIVPLG